MVGYWRLCSWLEGRGSERQRQTGREDWNGKRHSGDGGCCDRCDRGQGRLCEKTSLLWTLTPDKVSLFCLALLTPNKVSLSCLSLLSLSLSLTLSAKSRKTGLSSAMHVHLHTRVCRDICMTVYVQLCTSKTNILSLTKVVKGAHFPFTVECLEILGRVPKFWTF